MLLRSLRLLAVAALLTLGSLVPVSAGADIPIALFGDAAPDTGGGTYGFFFSGPAANASGEVAFASSIVGGTASSGVFVGAPGVADRKVALDGEIAPGTGGGTISGFSRPAINATGDVVFRTSVVGGTTSSGIFIESGGTVAPVVLAGDSAPGTGGGVFTSFGLPAMNDSGDVAFSASVDLIGPTVFKVSGGTPIAIALEGDTAPGVAGGAYEGFGTSGINAGGDVAFLAGVDTPTDFFEGIFVDSSGTDSLIALEGDAAPSTGTGTYFGFLFDNPAIDSSGRVSFNTGVSGAPSFLGGVFADVAGVDSALALDGDPAPGTGGGTYSSIVQSPTTNDAGDVAFRTSLFGGTASSGVFVDAGGTDAVVAIEGDAAPGTGGGSYSSFIFRPSMTATGQVAFGALVSGGTVSGGYFLPEPGSQVSWLAGAALVTLLARRRRG